MLVLETVLSHLKQSFSETESLILELTTTGNKINILNSLPGLNTEYFRSSRMPSLSLILQFDHLLHFNVILKKPQYRLAKLQKT